MNKNITLLINQWMHGCKFMSRQAFTLAEVLITLTVIGVVAAITISSLFINTNDMKYKSAYKKAFADIAIAVNKASNEGNFISAIQFDSATNTANFEALRDQFKTIKICDSNNNYDCWNEDGEFLTPIEGASLPRISGSSFIDSNGRCWSQYSSGERIILVDTNSNQGPNRMGKDRWAFYLDNNQTSGYGLPNRIIPPKSWTEEHSSSLWYCHYPPCYFRAWLYE